MSFRGKTFGYFTLNVTKYYFKSNWSIVRAMNFTIFENAKTAAVFARFYFEYKKKTEKTNYYRGIIEIRKNDG